MKQYLSTEQTAKLIELGFEKPRGLADADPSSGKWVREAYSIGELIEMLGGVSELEIIRFGSCWGAYDELRAFTSKELIDALYDMIIMLKEEEII